MSEYVSKVHLTCISKALCPHCPTDSVGRSSVGVGVGEFGESTILKRERESAFMAWRAGMLLLLLSPLETDSTRLESSVKAREEKKRVSGVHLQHG